MANLRREEIESEDILNNSRSQKCSSIDLGDSLIKKQQQALALINQGKLKEAEKIYRDLIATRACGYTIYRNLAAICGSQAKFSELIKLLNKALELNPNDPEVHFNLGIALQQQGDLTSAIDSYQKAVQLKINFPDAHFRLGNAQQLKGSLNAAITAYKTAIQLKHDFPDAHNNLGAAFQERGNLNAAIASYKTALRLKPDFLEAHVNCGNALKDKYCLIGAMAAYKEALQLKPDSPEAHNGIGCVHKEKNELTRAIISFKKAIRLKPNYPEAFNNLGNALKDKDDLTAAIASYKTAIQLRPKFADAYNNLGVALQENSNLTSAIASFNKAIELEPDNSEAHLYSSLAMLLNGEYEKGWEKYEWRNMQKGTVSTIHAVPNCKLWEGQPLKSESKLLLVTEQGLGDTLQFIRYALALKAQNLIIAICADTRLHPLIKSSDLDPSPLSPKQAEQVREGLWIPLMSVPRRLDVSPSKPIINMPYIKSSTELTKKWKDILSKKSKPTIGINWRGNRNDISRQSRNIPTHIFRKINEIFMGHLLPLQRGAHPSEIEEITSDQKMTPHQLDVLRIADSDEPEDFLEYAAIIANCDLVITTGSTVAHLAAGIGISTWVLLPKVPDWRWGLEGDTTFWYPSMRLFRQRGRGNWHEVIGRVAEALQEHFRDSPTPS
jgi:tetratricopeptide (TPR) repeat protein